MTESEMVKKLAEGFVEEVCIVRENMEKHGGHFVRALSQALLYADLKNSQKIKETWSDLWEVYLNWDKKKGV